MIVNFYFQKVDVGDCYIKIIMTLEVEGDKGSKGRVKGGMGHMCFWLVTSWVWGNQNFGVSSHTHNYWLCSWVTAGIACVIMHIMGGWGDP